MPCNLHKFSKKSSGIDLINHIACLQNLNHISQLPIPL